MEITPSLKTTLTEEEIKNIDFKNIFEITRTSINRRILTTETKTRIFPKENNFNFTLEEKTTLLLKFEPEDIQPNTTLKITLNMTTTPNFTIIKETTPYIRKDPKFTYLNNNTIEIEILTEEKPEEKTEEKKEIPGGEKTIAQISNVDPSIMTVLSSLDTSGMLIKSSQLLKVFNRFIFLDINYQKNLKPFLENCAKLDGKKNLKDEEIRIESGYREKFDYYGIDLNINGALYLNLIVYICSWILKLPIFYFTYKAKQTRKMPNKFIFRLVDILRKIKFSIFCSYAPNIVFFGIRILNHRKLDIGENFFEKNLIRISLILLSVDFIKIFLNMIVIMKSRNLQLEEEIDEEDMKRKVKNGERILNEEINESVLGLNQSYEKKNIGVINNSHLNNVKEKIIINSKEKIFENEIDMIDLEKFEEDQIEIEKSNDIEENEDEYVFSSKFLDNNKNIAKHIEVF